MICINKQNFTHNMILRTPKFHLCPLGKHPASDIKRVEQSKTLYK